MFHYFFNDKSLKYEYIEIDMANSDKKDFESASSEYLNSYIDKKFSKDLQSLYREQIGLIKAGFIAGINFIQTYYNINKKNDK